jgi:hypothetical protein
MCNMPSLSEALDPAGLSRKGKAAAGWKEVFDPAGFHEGALSGQVPKGHDPLQLSKGWHESDVTGAVAREEGERELAAAAARDATTEEEGRRRAAKNLAAGGGAGRGRASTMLTSPSGLLGGGTSARRTLMAG